MFLLRQSGPGIWEGGGCGLKPSRWLSGKKWSTGGVTVPLRQRRVCCPRLETTRALTGVKASGGENRYRVGRTMRCSDR